jgi:hypothetical protein
LPVALYGYETWSNTLREDRRLRVFENRLLKFVFGPKMEEVTGGWRILYIEELYNFYSLPNIIRIIKTRRMKLVEHVARVGEEFWYEILKERDHL